MSFLMVGDGAVSHSAEENALALERAQHEFRCRYAFGLEISPARDGLHPFEWTQIDHNDFELSLWRVSKELAKTCPALVDKTRTKSTGKELHPLWSFLDPNSDYSELHALEIPWLHLLLLFQKVSAWGKWSTLLQEFEEPGKVSRESQQTVWRVSKQFGEPENILENQHTVWRASIRFGEPANFLESQYTVWRARKSLESQKKFGELVNSLESQQKVWRSSK